MYFLINGHEHINVYPRIPEMLDKDPSTKRVRVILRIRLNDLTFFANPVSSKNLIYLLPSCAPLYMVPQIYSMVEDRKREKERKCGCLVCVYNVNIIGLSFEYIIFVKI